MLLTHKYIEFKLNIYCKICVVVTKFTTSYKVIILDEATNAMPTTNSSTNTSDTDYPDAICHTPADITNNSYTLNSFASANDSTIFSKLWSIDRTVPFYLVVLIFPLLNFKSPTFFTKFNCLGK